MLGLQRCQALPFFHAFTGSDVSMIGIGKITAWNAWGNFHEATTTFTVITQDPVRPDKCRPFHYRPTTVSIVFDDVDISIPFTGPPPYPDTSVTSKHMESGLVCEENGTRVMELLMFMFLDKVKSSSTVFPGENWITCWSSAVSLFGTVWSLIYFPEACRKSIWSARAVLRRRRTAIWRM